MAKNKSRNGGQDALDVSLIYFKIWPRPKSTRLILDELSKRAHFVRGRISTYKKVGHFTYRHRGENNFFAKSIFVCHGLHSSLGGEINSGHPVG